MLQVWLPWTALSLPSVCMWKTTPQYGCQWWQALLWKVRLNERQLVIQSGRTGVFKREERHQNSLQCMQKWAGEGTESTICKPMSEISPETNSDSPTVLLKSQSGGKWLYVKSHHNLDEKVTSVGGQLPWTRHLIWGIVFKIITDE